MSERMFPIMVGWSAKDKTPHPTQIPWSVADLAYSVYSANYGRGQSLERLAQRGGFSPEEMDAFCPDWRERVQGIESLTAEASTLRKRVEGYEKLLSEVRQLEIDTREDAYTLVQGRSDGKWRVFVNYEAELNDIRYPTVLDAYEAIGLAESSAIGEGNE